MDLTKKILDRLLLDTASLLIISTAALYCFGLFFASGSMTGYGLTEEMITLEFRETIAYGFVSLLAAPFLSPLIWLVSLIGLVPFFINKAQNNIPIFIPYLGLIFFIFLQFGACYTTGKNLSEDEIIEIENAYNGDYSEDFGFEKIKLEYKHFDKKVKTLAGYSLDIPGDFFVVILENKIIAIKRSDVISVSFVL